MSSEEFNKLDTNNKISYFNSLPKEKQKELFNQINEFIKEEVLNNLDYYNLKKFLNLYSKEEKKELIKLLMPYKLKYLYSVMDEKEKIEFNEIVNEIQINYNNEYNNLSTSIDNSRKTIQTLQENIVKSQNIIQAEKEKITDNKHELKDSNIRIKKISKEREKQFKKMLRRSKPSVLDKIGFIAKIRRVRLQNAINLLNEIDLKLNNELLYNSNIKQEIENSKNRINQELENIEQYRIKSNLEEKLIAKNTKMQQELHIRIKKLNAVEKRMYGRKLYKQRVSSRNLIGNARELGINRETPIQNNEQTNDNSQTITNQNVDNKDNTSNNDKENNSKEKVNDMINYLDEFLKKMENNDIHFEPLDKPLPPQPNPNILDNKIATLSNEQLITLLYTTIAVQQAQTKKIEEMQAMMNQSSRRLGYTSISILILIIVSLLITSTIYLFIS